MNFSELIGGIYNFVVQLMPMFRAFWTISIFVGIALLALALILKKNPERKKSPWIVGGIGMLMFISSGTQLLFSMI